MYNYSIKYTRLYVTCMPQFLVLQLHDRIPHSRVKTSLCEAETVRAHMYNYSIKYTRLYMYASIPSTAAS